MSNNSMLGSTKSLNPDRNNKKIRPKTAGNLKSRPSVMTQSINTSSMGTFAGG